MTKNLYLPDVSDKLPFGERLRALRTRVAFGMIGIAGEDNDDDDYDHNHNQDHDALIGIAGEEKVRKNEGGANKKDGQDAQLLILLEIPLDLGEEVRNGIMPVKLRPVLALGPEVGFAIELCVHDLQENEIDQNTLGRRGR